MHRCVLNTHGMVWILNRNGFSSYSGETANRAQQEWLNYNPNIVYDSRSFSVCMHHLPPSRGSNVLFHLASASPWLHFISVTSTLQHPAFVPTVIIQYSLTKSNDRYWRKKVVFRRRTRRLREIVTCCCQYHSQNLRKRSKVKKKRKMQTK